MTRYALATLLITAGILVGCASPEPTPQKIKWKEELNYSNGAHAHKPSSPSAASRKAGDKKQFGACSADDLVNFSCD